MVVLYHNHNKIEDLVATGHQNIDFDKNLTLAKGLHHLANRFPNEKIVWCHLDYKDHFDVKAIETVYHHHKLMLSYHPYQNHFMDKRLGYVDASVFINVNKKVSYPTWQMSSAVGVIHGSVLLEINDSIPLDSDFDYYLNSVAKLAMPLGLFCYSEPRLLRGDPIKPSESKTNIWTLFKFVKQHYKTRWLFLLALNLLLYEKRVALFPFLYGLCFKKRTKAAINLESIAVQSTKDIMAKANIDVIIPTIGRKTYLYDVLCDLRNQTYLPQNVIIVEQNPIEGSRSELDYLTSESWPFKISHMFTHKTGACQARNKALQQVKSEWVFLADDDIVIEKDFLYKLHRTVNQLPYKAFTFRCYLKGEPKEFNKLRQWDAFGSGCSVVQRKALNGCSFSEAYEYGFGEDSDFGMQLRNKGIDVIYVPEPSILHLKAPMGGFRTKPKLLWQEEAVQPKPSPTIMLYQLLHKTKEQQWGYKTLLFLKYYKNQSIKNPFKYYKTLRKQWSQSLKYANQLKNNNS
ncbi:glycosyltransferase family 2 protein [Flavisericum labens]|uniref:glycosyltransferase family 2 protein n=1 Tax=Flavisericum labens TaxID=3377112 RepID=UPI00387AFD8F